MAGQSCFVFIAIKLRGDHLKKENKGGYDWALEFANLDTL